MNTHRRQGWFAADLNVGDVFQHTPGRTIHAAENSLYCGMTMNSNSIHMDSHSQTDSEFGQPLMNALFVLSCVVGLSVSELAEGTAIANLAFTDVKFPAPVFAGDTVYASTRVISTRVSNSRRNSAIVEFEHTGTNQDGVVVCIGRRTSMMRHSPG